MALNVKEIAKFVDGKFSGDGEREIRGVASLEKAEIHDLTFAEGERQVAKASLSRAGCILVPLGAEVENRCLYQSASP